MESIEVQLLTVKDIQERWRVSDPATVRTRFRRARESGVPGLEPRRFGRHHYFTLDQVLAVEEAAGVKGYFG